MHTLTIHRYEVTDRRLKRHVVHDSGSRLFPANENAKAVHHRRIAPIFGIRSALWALQTGPISVGIPWPESFMNDRTGLLSMPRRPRYAGGHQIEISGYDAPANC